MLLSQIKHRLTMQRQTEYVSGYSASETVAEEQARFVEVVLPMNSMTMTLFVGIYVGTKEMAKLNTPFEQEQVGTVSDIKYYKTFTTEETYTADVDSNCNGNSWCPILAQILVITYEFHTYLYSPLLVSLPIQLAISDDYRNCWMLVSLNK